VFLAGKSPNIRSDVVHTYNSGQPCLSSCSLLSSLALCAPYLYPKQYNSSQRTSLRPLTLCAPSLPQKQHNSSQRTSLRPLTLCAPPPYFVPAQKIEEAADDAPLPTAVMNVHAALDGAHEYLNTVSACVLDVLV